jgi:hypothetical protein
LVGLVTSYDIQGERPIQFLQSSNYSRHQDVRIMHIMTPWDELLALDWESIESARAGELLALFQRTNLTHVLVVEIDRKTSHSVVRALASRARLLRQLAGAGSGLVEPSHRADAREGHQQRPDQVRTDRH